MKRYCILPLCIIALLALVCGCSAKQARPQPQDDGTEIRLLSASPATPLPGADVRYAVYCLDEGEQLEEYGNYDSDMGDENAVLVRDGAVLTLQNAGVNKSGDGRRELMSGLNAAAACIFGSELRMLNSTVTTNALGAPGLFCSGEHTRLGAEDSKIVTAGANSPALVCSDGAEIWLNATNLNCEADDAPLIVTYGDVTVTLCSCALRFTAPRAIVITGGTLSLTLDGQQLIGDIELTGTEENPAGLTLMLRNGASFTGAILTDDPEGIRITMDEMSLWTLTGETWIAALTAPDKNFLGIQSNGFNIYYNSSLDENAWLAFQSYLLPGGGYLAPLI